ncbi:MAG: hypothetical protein RBT01_12535 [Anaerolineaceae bacterium]|nr:hypothetical protein [Anaerolineaceae bacterium]
MKNKKVNKLSVYPWQNGGAILEHKTNPSFFIVFPFPYPPFGRPYGRVRLAVRAGSEPARTHAIHFHLRGKIPSINPTIYAHGDWKRQKKRGTAP